MARSLVLALALLASAFAAEEVCAEGQCADGAEEAALLQSTATQKLTEVKAHSPSLLSETTYCNPNEHSPPQMCPPGNVECPQCGSDRCECPSPATQNLTEVLLIIDMQNDYDLSYNMETYGYKKNPWANELLSASQHIRNLIDDVDWDMIVFTQDWLIPVLTDQPPEHEFCLADTPGASPLSELLDAADRKTSNQLRYTKNVDDAFNTISPNPVLAKCEPGCSVPEDYPNRCYDSNNTYNGTFLVDVLKGRGYTPSNTKITIVGTEADMCVLTSTLHAMQYGFKVDVYEPGLNGGWDGPSDWCDIDVSSPGWEEKAFECQGAAGRKEALGYMEAAGARVLWQLPSVSPGLA